MRFQAEKNTKEGLAVVPDPLGTQHAPDPLEVRGAEREGKGR